MSASPPAPPSLVDDLEDLFENAPCGYLSTDKDGRIGRANATMSRWLGVEAAELAGRRFSDLLTIGGKLFYETHFAPLLRMQGSFNEVALDLALPAGERLPVLVNAVERRDGGGRPLFVRFTLFVAAERRRYERNLMAAKSSAEQAMQAERVTAEFREQFIAVLGHDLRNPLASLAGGVSLLRKNPARCDRERILALMEASLGRAARLIDDVMDFANGRLGGGVPIAPEPAVALAPMLEQIVAEFRSMIGEPVIEARIEVPDPVEADRDRIGQLVSNLLGNALTHGAAGKPVQLAASTAAGVFALSVANAGEPITPLTMERLFQPFFRGAARQSQQGLGLGLYIASEIAKAHGGAITVDSDVSETRFTFTMPCRRAASAGAAPSS